MNAALDVESLRGQFPALDRRVNDQRAVFFDGPAGSQVPQRVVDAVSRYLTDTNANNGGAFATSLESGEVLAEAHCAVADLLGADDPAAVCFGPNMTTLTLALSRALARTWEPGDEVVVTHLDHDANFTPWVLAARDAGATVHRVRIRPEDCALDLEDLRSKLSPRTRLVAVSCASNAVGNVNPVKEIARWVHEVGGQIFLDAVHYAPHAAIDVVDWDCDYLVCSAYKFFGPHVGALWGKRELLGELPTYKVRPAADDLPDRWMSGTQNHEGIAGTLEAINYLADIGRSLSFSKESAPGATERRRALLEAFRTIGEHERQLARHLISRLAELPDIRVWGITDPARLDERVPTISFTHARRTPGEVAAHLGERGIFVWSGNFYALPLTEALGLEPSGLVRVGILHYNTEEEVDRLVEALREL
ncbi:MAG: cysteine desulfurase-like protein [Planctomycetota bacterium]|nr:cysteine desulfurase-like protein [Planctomycetota bacterium]